MLKTRLWKCLTQVYLPLLKLTELYFQNPIFLYNIIRKKNQWMKNELFCVVFIKVITFPKIPLLVICLITEEMAIWWLTETS